VTVSPRVAIEFEPSFGGRNSWEYTYRPSPSLFARVVASRRDMFFPVQARFRWGVLEPVVGVSFVYTRISWQSTVGSDVSRTDDNVALVGGVDAALKLVSSLYVVPTFRVLFLTTGTSPDTLTDPLGARTSTGSLESDMVQAREWGSSSMPRPAKATCL
jgi:hypothetical protein